MYINLSGLNILVTGASKGIGKAIATKLAEAGATIAIHYNKNVREAENLASVLGNESRAFQADLSKPDEAANLFDRVALEMGSIEILVNNAGMATASDISSKEGDWLDIWNNTLQVNLSSCAILCKKTVEFMLKRNSTGRIINIVDNAGFKGDSAEYMAYAASKAGLISITKTIAQSYGKKGIKAFNISPGIVRTEMGNGIIETKGNDKATKDIALERMTEPKDIAPMVTFLASGMADHATGSTIDLNAASYLH
ncbi:SDR family NAD(P)-dependent oxidoreductase [Reichenbachiella versicolor]|uniref:SDR family NAD(P)-dependent oxidoreductase n=1 Tax=Reichenbachiella versicolor TaxID=1821036 RepID=UPI000D6E8C1B|nr:SDR family oxidoreductase [Reichenbachiella versicolor]